MPGLANERQRGEQAAPPSPSVDLPPTRGGYRLPAAVGSLLAFVALLGFLAWWYRAALLFAQPLADERCYLQGAAAVAVGDPLYGTSCFLSPPAFAHLLAEVQRHLGEAAVLLALRGLNVLGLATVFWLALATPVPRPTHRALAGAALAVALPAVPFALEHGNISPLTAALILGGLTLAHRAPLPAGLLLGTSAAFKPMMPGALAVLMSEGIWCRLRGQPWRSTPGGSRTTAANRDAGGLAADAGQPAAVPAASGLIALLVAAALLLVPSDLSRYLEVGGVSAGSTSVHRLFHLAGWTRSGLPVLIGVSLIACWLVLHLRPTPAERVTLAIAAVLTTTPLVWSHTLLLALPLQADALTALFARRRAAAVPWPESAGIGLMVLAPVFSEGITSMIDQPAWMQALGVLPTATAPALLAAYVIACSRRVADPRNGERQRSRAA